MSLFLTCILIFLRTINLKKKSPNFIFKISGVKNAIYLYFLCCLIGKCLCSPPAQEKMEKQAAEGWEYAPLFNMKFHAKERGMDLVRRRRWHKKMIATSPTSQCFFSMAAPEVRVLGYMSSYHTANDDKCLPNSPK